MWRPLAIQSPIRRRGSGLWCASGVEHLHVVVMLRVEARVGSSCWGHARSEGHTARRDHDRTVGHDLLCISMHDLGGA